MDIVARSGTHFVRMTNRRRCVIHRDNLTAEVSRNADAKTILLTVHVKLASILKKVEALFNRAEREVKDGLLPSTQIAIARNGKIGAMRTVGRAVQGGTEKPATNDTLYTIFSCTKAIVSAASWILIGEGKLKTSERVAEIIPEFGTNGKDTMTVEQVLLHVGGFPNAPYPQDEWLDKSKRLERFAKWRLEWPVGSKFEYHPTSGFWAIAEIIERRNRQGLSSVRARADFDAARTPRTARRIAARISKSTCAALLRRRAVVG